MDNYLVTVKSVDLLSMPNEANIALCDKDLSVLIDDEDSRKDFLNRLGVGSIVVERIGSSITDDETVFRKLEDEYVLEGM